MPPRPSRRSMRYPASSVPMRWSVAILPAGVVTPAGPPGKGSAREELGQAVADRGRQLALGPGAKRLVVAGRGEGPRVVGLALEPGPFTPHLVYHHEVEV